MMMMILYTYIQNGFSFTNLYKECSVRSDYIYIYKYWCNFLDTKIDVAEQAITMQMPWSVIKNNKRQTTNLYAMILISG